MIIESDREWARQESIWLHWYYSAEIAAIEAVEARLANESGVPAPSGPNTADGSGRRQAG